MCKLLKSRDILTMDLQFCTLSFQFLFFVFVFAIVHIRSHEWAECDSKVFCFCGLYW